MLAFAKMFSKHVLNKKMKNIHCAHNAIFQYAWCTVYTAVHIYTMRSMHIFQYA